MTLPAITQLGQISGQQLGQAIFQFSPAFPGEGPPFMPRVLAKALFPRGFAPGMILPAELPVPTPQVVQAAALIPPAGIPAQPANQRPAQPANQRPAPPVDRDRDIRFRRMSHRRGDIR